MKAIKRQIYLNKEQIDLFNRTKSACRFVYNKMIEINSENYKKDNKSKFIGYVDFSKLLNNYYRKNFKDEYGWLDEIPSKPIKESLRNCDKAFKKFFKKEISFPKFKSKKTDKSGIYIPKNNKKDFTVVFRNKIKIPLFGFVYLKEFGLLDLSNVTSCTIVERNYKYYINFLIKEENKIIDNNLNGTIGIDLGIKNLAVLSNGTSFKGISKNKKIKKLNKKLKRLNRSLSRKLEANKNRKEESTKKSNIVKTVRFISNIHASIKNITEGYINNIIDTVVITKPKNVVIETLNVSGIIKNHKLAKHIHSSCFYKFSRILEYKCSKNNINLIKADKFYPSTQMCSNCGNVKLKEEKLTLNDRIYECNCCGFKEDRDLNAAINLSKLV